MQEHVGVPVGNRTKTIDQMNGNRNSARGYEVGRAVIEALANHGDVDANIRGDVTDMPSTGYMGRLRNDNFIKLYKQHYGEAVRDWAQNDMGSHVDSQGRRMMTMAELDAVINSYDALAQRLREVGFEGLTPAEKQRISQVKYDNMEDVGLAPEDILKDLTGRLKTVRQQYEERVAMVEMLPPAVMSTLHDEYKFLNDAHASVFGVGVIPGEEAVQGLRPDVSGDAGLAARPLCRDPLFTLSPSALVRCLVPSRALLIPLLFMA